MKIPGLLLPLYEQVQRFVRLFVAALITQGVALDFKHLDRSVVVAAVVGAAEVAYKELAAQVQQVKNNNPDQGPLDTGVPIALPDDPAVGTDLGEDNPPDPNG